MIVWLTNLGGTAARLAPPAYGPVIFYNHIVSIVDRRQVPMALGLYFLLSVNLLSNAEGEKSEILALFFHFLQ